MNGGDILTLPNGLDIDIHGDQVNVKEYMSKFDIEFKEIHDKYVPISEALKEISDYEAPYQNLLDLYAKIKSDSHEQLLEEQIRILQDHIYVLRQNIGDDEEDEIDIKTIREFLERANVNEDIHEESIIEALRILEGKSSNMPEFIKELSKVNGYNQLSYNEQTVTQLVTLYAHNLLKQKQDWLDQLQENINYYTNALADARAAGDARAAALRLQIDNLNIDLRVIRGQLVNAQRDLILRTTERDDARRVLARERRKLARERRKLANTQRDLDTAKRDLILVNRDLKHVESGAKKLREQLKNTKEQLAQVDVEKADLERQLAQVDVEKADLERRIIETQNLLSYHIKVSQSRLDNININKNIIEQLNKDVRELREKCKNLDIERNDLNAKILQKDADIRANNKKIQKLNIDISQLNANNAFLKNDIEDKKTKIKELQANLQKKTNELNDKTNEFDNITVELKRNKALVQQFVAKLKTKNDEYARLELALNTAQANATVLNDQLTRIQNQLDLARTTITSNKRHDNETIKNLEKTQNKLNEQLNRANDNVKLLREQLAQSQRNIQIQIDLLNENNEKFNEQIDILQQQLHDEQEKARLIQEDLDNANNEKARIQKDLENANTNLTANATQISSLETELQKKTNEASELNRQLIETRNNVTQLTENINKANEDKENIQKQLNQAIADNDTLTEANEKQAEDLNNAKILHEQDFQRITELENENKILNTQAQTTEADLEEANEKIQRLEQQIQIVESDSNSKNEQIEKLKQDLDNAHIEAQQKLDEFNGLQSKLTENELKLQQLRKDLDDRENTIKNNTNTIDDLNKKISEFEDQIYLKNEELSKIKRDCENAKRDYEQAKLNLEATTDELNATKRELHDLQASTVSSSVHQTEIEKINKNIENLNQQIVQAKDDYDTRKQTLEHNETEYKSKLNELEELKLKNRKYKKENKQYIKNIRSLKLEASTQDLKLSDLIEDANKKIKTLYEKYQFLISNALDINALKVDIHNNLHGTDIIPSDPDVKYTFDMKNAARFHCANKKSKQINMFLKVRNIYEAFYDFCVLRVFIDNLQKMMQNIGIERKKIQGYIERSNSIIAVSKLISLDDRIDMSSFNSAINGFEKAKNGLKLDSVYKYMHIIISMEIDIYRETREFYKPKNIPKSFSTTMSPKHTHSDCDICHAIICNMVRVLNYYNTEPRFVNIQNPNSKTIFENCKKIQ